MPVNVNIGIAQNGSIYMNTSHQELRNDILELSIGPSDDYNGIKACLTYNSPGESKPGYQKDRGVSFMFRLNEIISIKI